MDADILAEPNLLLICLNAFVAVMLLLSTLAGGMRFFMWLFPGHKHQPDSATAAAIAAAVSVLLPGHQVSRIETVRKGTS